MQLLRRELLQSALKFYQDFLKERGADPTLRGELAAAYLRLGTIRMELLESNEAIKAWSKAGEIYELLTKSAPDSVEWRHGLAQSNYGLGHYEEAIALWQKLVQPGQQRFQKELAKAYTARGFYHSRAGRSAEAVEAYQQSLAIREMLVRLNPDDLEAQNDLGTSLSGIASILDNKGRSADALVMYRRAGEYHKAAFTRTPQVLLNGYRLASSQLFIAKIENRLGHTNEALAAYRQVVETYRKMVRDNPAVPSLHNPLLRAYWWLAQYQRNLEQTEQAKETLRLAHEAIERMPSDGPDALFHVACIRADYAAFIAQENDKRTAQEQAEQKQEADLAIEMLRKALTAGFRDVERFRKATDLNALRGREDFKALEAALAARAAAAPTDKLRANQQALDLRQRIAQADPKNKRLQADLAASQHAIALAQLDLGKLEEAQQHLDQAVALREALIKGEPKNEQYQADVAASRLYMDLARARRFAEQKRKTEAEAALAQIEVFPSNDAQAHKERGRTYFALGQTDKATAEFRKAVGLSDDETLETLALPSEPAASETDKLFAQLADDALLRKMTAAVERIPGDMGLRWKRAYWHACHARWKEAAADWRISLEQKPTDNALDWLHVAPALAAGDGASYRWLCREMLKRFGETQDPMTADRVAKACMLLPEFAKEMGRAFQLAELAAVQGKNHLYSPYFIFCKGLADYRRGNLGYAERGHHKSGHAADMTSQHRQAGHSPNGQGRH